MTLLKILRPEGSRGDPGGHACRIAWDDMAAQCTATKFAGI